MAGVVRSELSVATRGNDKNGMNKKTKFAWSAIEFSMSVELRIQRHPCAGSLLIFSSSTFITTLVRCV